MGAAQTRIIGRTRPVMVDVNLPRLNLLRSETNRRPAKCHIKDRAQRDTNSVSRSLNTMRAFQATLHTVV